MKRSLILRPATTALLASTVMLGLVLRAFPPAPHHTVFGQVRDEYGAPISRPGAEVWMESGSAVLAKSPLRIDPEPGVNYRMEIPMDSGATSDLYVPTAMQPFVPFRLRVKVGNLTYLPIEMTGAASLVTRPGAVSRVNLTLGVDSDNDGLPDAWERSLIDALGGGKGVADVGPDDDSDGDGLSNLQEYLAGTYAFDPQDGFNLAILSSTEGRATLEFLAIRGRTYSLRVSEDLSQWTSVPFKLSTDPAVAAERNSFRASDTRVVRPVVAPQIEGGTLPKFFRVIVH